MVVHLSQWTPHPTRTHHAAAPDPPLPVQQTRPLVPLTPVDSVLSFGRGAVDRIRRLERRLERQSLCCPLVAAVVSCTTWEPPVRCRCPRVQHHLGFHEVASCWRRCRCLTFTSITHNPHPRRYPHPHPHSAPTPTLLITHTQLFCTPYQRHEDQDLLAPLVLCCLYLNVRCALFVLVVAMLLRRTCVKLVTHCLSTTLLERELGRRCTLLQPANQ